MLHVAALFAGCRSGVVVAIGKGARRAARPLVPVGALGAVDAAKARGHVAGCVACLDVVGAVLAEQTHKNVSAGLQISGSEKV